ncbi:MAG: cytochrome b/b6 domain-containing protein, partial [Planctomycetota bacterium]
FGLAYFFRNAVTRNARQYIRKPQDGMKGLLKQARFYLYGIFRGEPHPYHATPERKFNSLQQITYAGVMYLLFPILIVTGIILFFPRMLPDKIGDLPGVWWFATIHYLSAAAVIVFLLAHIYLATMGDRVGYLLSAMFTGRHRQHVPKRHEGAAAAGGESVPE